MKVRADDVVVAAGLSRFDLASDSVTVARMPRLMETMLGSGVHAITLGSRIFVASDRYDGVVQGSEPELIAHELLHVEQWRRHGKLGFLSRYLSDYVRLRILGLTHAQAYHGIGFEHVAFKESKRMVEIL
ncbi:MAG: eCIS core domain-containing protein [Acidimicrobiia bacterium]